MVLLPVEHPYDEVVESRRVGSAWAAALAFDAVLVGFRACYHVGCRDAVDQDRCSSYDQPAPPIERAMDRFYHQAITGTEEGDNKILASVAMTPTSSGYTCK